MYFFPSGKILKQIETDEKLFTQASVGKAESKNASRPSSSSSTSHLVAKLGVMVPGCPAKCEETEDENATALALRENVVFAKKVWEGYRRRCRSLSEQVGQRMILLETCRISKVHSRSHEITKGPCTSC